MSTLMAIAQARQAERTAKMTVRMVRPGSENLWRQLYTSIFLQPQAIDHHIITISSALKGEGKTTVALGMATVMAGDLEKAILLVDCNFANPSLSKEVGMSEGVGLVDYLTREAALTAIIRRSVVANLSVIPAGSKPDNPSKLVRSQLMADLMQKLRAQFDIVILDVPSYLSSADTRILIAYSNGLLLVARANHSTTRQVAEVLAGVEGTAKLGIVVNDFTTTVPGFLQRYFRGS